MPNVSLCTQENEVHFNPLVQPSHDFVEIGGVKWATMNIGATAVTDTGLYFQWGDNSGYTASQIGWDDGKKPFDIDEWSDYKFLDSFDSSTYTATFTKYNGSDGKTVLEASDDAAHVYWGGSWRMPTTAEWQALGAAVNSAWTTNYQGSGVNGLVCTDKTDSSKVLFFPACGGAYDGSVRNVGSLGYYWSSSLLSDDVNNAWNMNFNSNEVNWDNNNNRYNGYAVRGVLG